MTSPPRTNLAVGIAASVGLFVAFDALLEGQFSLGRLLASVAGGGLVFLMVTSEMRALERWPAMIVGVALSAVLVALALWLHV